MNIIGDRILLRALEPGDMAQLHAWANDPEVATGLGELHFPSSLWQQERWYERTQTNEGTIRLAIQTTEGSLIGYTGFWRINWRDRRAEHALAIGDTAHRGQGYGREVILTCARYAFEMMDLYRLDANILATNTASLNAYEACGFQIEGVQRGHAFRSGDRVDRNMLGLLAREFWASLKADDKTGGGSI